MLIYKYKTFVSRSLTHSLALCFKMFHKHAWTSSRRPHIKIYVPSNLIYNFRCKKWLIDFKKLREKRARNLSSFNQSSFNCCEMLILTVFFLFRLKSLFLLVAIVATLFESVVIQQNCFAISTCSVLGFVCQPHWN